MYEAAVRSGAEYDDAVALHSRRGPVEARPVRWSLEAHDGVELAVTG